MVIFIAEADNVFWDSENESKTYYLELIFKTVVKRIFEISIICIIKICGWGFLKLVTKINSSEGWIFLWQGTVLIKERLEWMAC